MVDWPSLGVAGGAVIAFLLLLGWLIRQIASGALVPRSQHDAELARVLEDKRAAEATSKAWADAHGALVTVHSETVATLKQATDANRYLDILLQRAGVPAETGGAS